MTVYFQRVINEGFYEINHKKHLNYNIFKRPRRQKSEKTNM